MLILTRRIGETLCIGEDIKLTVFGIKGNQVRFGIDAPKEVRIDREEIRERKNQGLPAPRHEPRPLLTLKK